MYRAMLMCIALAMASPLTAQQAAPAPPTPPPASELSPPPPFPHYPKIAPREHDPNWHRPARSHSHSKPRHAAKARHVKTHRRATAHRATAHHGAKRLYFSRRTIRQCHRMSYSQIMGHKYCRLMMKQDIAAKARSSHHASRHSAARHKKARRHRG